MGGWGGVRGQRDRWGDKTMRTTVSTEKAAGWTGVNTGRAGWTLVPCGKGMVAPLAFKRGGSEVSTAQALEEHEEKSL